MYLLLFAASIGLQPGDSMQRVDFLRLSYKANKEAFAFGTFHFEFTRGSSASPSDAEAGVFSKAIREDGLYIFDGKNGRYELIAEPKELAAMTTRVNERKTVSLARTFRALTDGKATLVDFLVLNESSTSFYHRPEIYADPSMFHEESFFKFPLWLGDDDGHPMDLFRDLTAIRDGRATLIDLDTESSLEGIKVCKLSFAFAEGKCTYWIDMSRGFIPLRILAQYKRNDAQILQTFGDLEHIPDAGWLPRRRMQIMNNGAVVDRIVVTQIDVKNRPQSSDFRLDFPEPVSIRDRARNLDYAGQKSWSLLKLPSRSSPGTTPIIPGHFILPDESSGEIDAGPPWSIIVAAGSVVLIVLSSVVILRRRKKRITGV
jgi:hypothetical protein